MLPCSFPNIMLKIKLEISHYVYAAFSYFKLTCHVCFVHQCICCKRSVVRFSSFGLVSSFIRFRWCLAVCVLVCVFLFC